MGPTEIRFLAFRLPFAALALALVVELAAWGVSGVGLQRHPLDRTVAALSSGMVAGDTVLLGDSVTQDVAGMFRLADPGRVANLTTNKASGPLGSVLLLRRYLEQAPSVRRVVVAATPEFFTYMPDGETARVYLSSVFTREDERPVLSAAGLPMESDDWKPAILDFEARVFDRLSALVLAQPLPAGDREPDPALPVEDRGGNAVKEDAIKTRMVADMPIDPGASIAIESLCTLAKERNIALDVVWAPVPDSVYRFWLSAGTLRDLRDRIADLGGGACGQVRFHDMNNARRYPDFAFRDSDHLRRPGWTNVYALALKDFLAE
ncbi:hypothetical protein [Pacificispira spongiicola]|nr:hypothetical protein [Pacificispira spongiicola]